jgi:hypothetical protein
VLQQDIIRSNPAAAFNVQRMMAASANQKGLAIKAPGSVLSIAYPSFA